MRVSTRATPPGTDVPAIGRRNSFQNFVPTGTPNGCIGRVRSPCSRRQVYSARLLRTVAPELEAGCERGDRRIHCPILPVTGEPRAPQLVGDCVRRAWAAAQTLVGPRVDRGGSLDGASGVAVSAAHAMDAVEEAKTRGWEARRRTRSQLAVEASHGGLRSEAHLAGLHVKVGRGVDVRRCSGVTAM